ncbi:hypothetical protein ACWV95_15410 [Streptomyces albus]
MDSHIPGSTALTFEANRPAPSSRSGRLRPLLHDEDPVYRRSPRLLCTTVADA